MSSLLTSGTIFAGRYRILRCIGQGAMGAVYEVVHLDTERHRALKVMHAHILQSDNLRERFKREAKVAAHIVSEHLVDVLDAGVDEATGSPFMLMELLRGEELGRLIKRVGRLPPGEATAYLHQAALALDATHKAQIVHRDITPANLFLTERSDGQPRIKVLDFGVAKLVAESASEGETATIGTPLYMAPEQFNPHARLTGAADIYALGMVAYTLLTGRAYWAAEAKEAGVYALAAVSMLGPQEPASLRAAACGVQLPAGFDGWFTRTTAQNPAERYASATEAVRALGSALSVPISATVAGQVWEVWSPPSVDRAPGERVLASRPVSVTARSPDDRASSAQLAQTNVETTMLPAIQPAGAVTGEPAHWNRKRALVGALGALGLGMLIGFRTDALRTHEPQSSGPGGVRAAPEAVTALAASSANVAERIGVALPGSAWASSVPAAPSGAPATSASSKRAAASAPTSAKGTAERAGDRRPSAARSAPAKAPKTTAALKTTAAPKTATPASRWPPKMYTRE